MWIWIRFGLGIGNVPSKIQLYNQWREKFWVCLCHCSWDGTQVSTLNIYTNLLLLYLEIRLNSSIMVILVIGFQSWHESWWWKIWRQWLWSWQVPYVTNTWTRQGFLVILLKQRVAAVSTRKVIKRNLCIICKIQTFRKKLRCILMIRISYTLVKIWFESN